MCTDQTQIQPIPENSPQFSEQSRDVPDVSADTNEEYHAETDEPATDNTELASTSDCTQPTPRNNITRYNLRAEPNPKTYRDVLVHELRVKPALLKLMQDKKVN